MDSLRSRTFSVAAGLGALALVFAIGHWALSRQPAVFGWVGSVMVVLCAFAVQGLCDWRLGAPQSSVLGSWFTQHLPLLAVLASTVGSIPFWLELDGALAATAWMASMLTVAAAAGAHLLATHRVGLCLWLLPLLSPLMVKAVWSQAPLTAVFGLWALATLALTFFSAGQRRELLIDAVDTNQSNDALVRELRHQMALVEQANRDKSRFLAAASHDLRQPMHALGLFAATLEKSLAQTPLLPTVMHMTRAVDALEQSCSAMLDLSKLDAGVVEPSMQSFPIRDLFRRLHMHCAGQAEELGLALRFKAGGRIVTSDPQLLERVLANLIHNAIRYTRQGGIVVMARDRQGRVSLEVWDTGIGISAEDLPKVFDEFYQVSNSGRDRTRGLGMGLAIVKRLVTLMGHEVEVKSRPGRGTVFRVLLAPTDLEDMATMVQGAETLPAFLELDRTALIIDDEESIRIGMRDLLQTWGFEVLMAATIEQACIEVRRHASVIDIVLSDLRLANQEDGIDAIERVREAYGAPLPAVLITGDTSAIEVKRAHDSGHQVLFKPVRSRDLYALLRAVP